MTASQPDLAKRILYILHWGLVEARNLALCGDRQQQVSDLADALETLPGELNDWKPDSLASITFNLRTYQDKYRGRCHDYLKYLEGQDPPSRF